MDKSKVIKYAKIVVTCLIVVIVLYFFLIGPFIKFKDNENKMLNATKRYFEINSDELPTGNRVKTIDLKTLYYKKFITSDLKIPNSIKSCSASDSWVKVKKVHNEYKYYVYLKCGALSSNVDHKGPDIILNGDDEITVNKGDEYKELGVKSVSDNTDGKLNVKDVSVDNSSVKTNKVGIYKVTYKIKDSFNNETVKIRKVNVVSVLYKTVKKATNNTGIYKGETNINNYITLSGMLFRIVGVDSDNNVKVVSDEDISYINYKSLDKWLEYYYDHLTDNAKEYIVKSKYCNDSLNDNDMKKTKCSSYTEKKNAYILSLEDYNNSLDENENSYLYPTIISLLSNTKNGNKEVYTTRSFFLNTDSKYMSFDINYNFGVRPVLTLKGSSLIKSGDGSSSNPYSYNDFSSGNVSDNLNARYSGEYISYSGYRWRVIETEKEGATKVILDGILNDSTTKYSTTDSVKLYNPEQKGNVGYFINNNAAQYVDTSYFVSKNITVPIYKENASYKNEISTKKYKVKLSAPNMYELFSASNDATLLKSYWLLNSSKSLNIKYIVSNNGTVYYGEVLNDNESEVRAVAYFDKECTIKSGKGTRSNPYKIAK